MPRWLAWVYEVFIAILAIIALISLARPDDPAVDLLNLVIWGIFLLDYGVRLLRAPDRRAFVRTHIPELISIIPLDFIGDFDPWRLTRIARLVRFVRLMRVGAVFYRINKDALSLLRTGGIGYILALSAGLVLLGGFAIWLIEPEVGTIGDGIWWSIVTVTTVGYGDFVPITLGGRMVAVGLMVVGISTLAALTGAVASHVVRSGRAENPHIQHVWQYLQKWDELPPAERQRVAALLTTLADQPEEKTPSPPKGERVG